jgi:2'-5' RNA ligase
MAASDLRLFVALMPPPELSDELDALTERVRRLAPKARLSDADHQHLTLRFLGAVPRADLEDVSAAVDVAAAAVGPFELVVRSAGTFGPERRPRVLYGDLAAGSDEVAAIAAALDDGLEAPRDMPLVAHWTLARSRARGGDATLAAAREALEGEELLRFPAVDISLVHSDTGSGPAIYRVIHAVPLTGGEAASPQS